ncbi:two-component regulator propeller domain-containing protein [Bacteroides sp. 519]|uniref:hybrid sensor histidine kinase/response regulator transcription factor n=1 Tax=Bacteroides sp. 519 TaxID=2302937 RepID=UPI001EF392BE|nr:two-component regulator propeller domain-containing protein [Bacteroides sp. 519]
MKKIILIFVFVTLLFYPLQLWSQTGRFFSTDKELSNSLVNKVYQDRKGYIWIATEDGLNKFDGIRFSIYRHIKGDSTSLKNNYVRTLYEDSYGNFWIGCINGLQIYNRATDTFREVDIYRNNAKVNPHITGIVERRNGEIWMSTSGQGVISVKHQPDDNSRINIETELTDRMGSIYLNAIFEDSQKYLWIATEDKGLYRFSPETNSLYNFKAPHDLSGDDVSAIIEDRRGNIFVGTLTNGVFLLRNTINGYEESFRRVPYKKNVNLNVKTLTMGKQGNLFIGTDGDGLKVYNSDSNEIEDYEINAAPFDFSKSKVHSILEDRDNNLWLGIFQKGLILIPGTINKFHYYGYKSIMKNTIGSGCVMSIWHDRQNVTWVGTDNDGLYAINDDGEQIRHYLPTSGPSSIPGTVMAMYEDSNNTLWLGSYFNGLARMNKNTGSCEYIQSPPWVGNRPGSEKISCITEDNDKHLWVGTLGAGIQRVNLQTQQISYYESTREESNDWTIDRLPNDWINSIIKGTDGMLWIGTYNGLACYNPQKQTFINYLNRSNLLPGYVVLSLLESSDNHIWIGTSEGLVCFNKATEEFTYYTTANGIPSDIICGMAEDERGNIWISTHQGLSKLVHKERKFVNYYAADGLQGNEFSRGAVFKDYRGRMYFGGTDGVTTFYPKEIMELKKDLKIVITQFYRSNQAVTPVMDTDVFTLAYNDNTFSLEFSAFEFNNPERIVYQYKIDELTDEWISTHSGVNRVTFTNLNPGSYTFRVRASDHDNLSNTRTVTILITPPWYQTTWATIIWVLIICFVLFMIVMYILSRFRHRQQILEKEHQEQLNEAKLQFFINISHEIRTPMTLIISPLEKLLAEGDALKQATYLRIYRNAQRILRLINQLMDIRKLDKGQMHLKFRETDIVGFIDDLMQTFEYQAEKKGIRFNFRHADEKLMVWIDLNNFDKVLMNVFSNAFKYTPDGGEIDVNLTTGTDVNVRGPLRKYFEIQVSDTGIGINKEDIEQIFERFYQVNNDVTSSNFGTGIGLHLSRSLVTLHHGTIIAENKEEGGTRFVIRIPLGSDHLRADELENPALTDEDKVLVNKADKFSGLLNEVAEANQEKQKTKTRYRVLVVEDDDEIRNFITEELGVEYRINECCNGKEAWEFILKEKPDLVISDVMMPEMDGITLSRKIKQHININHIPVILLTAKSKTEDRIEGLETGADAYFVKPFNTDLLKTTIYNLITNRELLKSKFTSEKHVEEKLEKIEKKSNDDILMEKIMKTINEHLADSSLNVEMLAASVGMSRVHMHRKLKELTGQSARDFIKSIRLKQAATLLREDGLTVSEVAYAIGFTNVSHFSNSFKEFTGMSPTEYKDKAEFV